MLNDHSLLESLILKLMEENEVIGFSIGIIHDSKLIWKNAYGFSQNENEDKLTENHLMDVGSLTKPVFAYAILQLEKRGLIDLDAPLSNYLDEPYIADERIFQITARMCLTHKTGFPNWRSGRFSRDPKPLEIYFMPNSRYSYSGEGYVYLQKVLEKITNQTFDKFISENIFNPLNMNKSSFMKTNLQGQSIASGHNLEKKSVIYHYDKANAAFSMRSTPTDYSKFLISILSPPIDDVLLLDSQDIKNMLAFQTAVSDDEPPYSDKWPRKEVSENSHIGWSLGWGLQNIDDEELFWHWGDNGVYKTFVIASSTDKTGVVLMSNSNSGSKMWKDLLKNFYHSSFPIFPYLDICNPGYL